MPTPVYQSIAQSIADHDVDTMFGLMGDANLFLSDHFARVMGRTFVPVAIEGSAVLMAQGYAMASGRIGVASITHGPALTNCVTALTEGARNRVPMVLLAGDTPVTEPNHSQAIDQREVVAITGAGFEQIRAPKTAPADVARAFYRARMEMRPIVVNMPSNFMWQEIEHETVVLPVFGSPTFVPEGDDVDEAVGMIASAKRPIILAGEGAIASKDKLIALAERLEAPLATTLKAKGLFQGHPLNMGIFGTLSTPAAYDVIAAADCVAAFGTSLHHFTTDKGKLTQGKRVVLVNNTAPEVTRNMHPDAAIIADAGLTADNIMYWLDEAEIPPSGFSSELDIASLTLHPSTAKPAKTGYVDYVSALERLNTALPDNRILTTDGGRFMTEVWCRIATPDAQSFVASTAFGSIGLGLQQAIGAAAAMPNRPVVMFTGDGGFMMGGLGEFNTAVRMKQDLIVVMCNDSAYGAEHIQMRDRNIDPTLTTFDWPSFAEVATALGGTGVTVASADDLDVAADAIATRDRPLLIDLRLHPDDVPRMRI